MKKLTLLSSVLGFAVLVQACGQLPPVPATFAPQDYELIPYRQLLAAGGPALKAGQKVRVAAYFWQFLEYEPAMVRNYLNLFRRPLAWYRLEWCSLYETQDMRGYFDRVAMDPGQRQAFHLERLEHIEIYGQMAALGPGLLYLRVDRLEKILED